MDVGDLEARTLLAFDLKEMIDTAKANGSTYESYLWESPKGGFFDKVTYAQAFAPFGWVISGRCSWSRNYTSGLNTTTTLC